jgi:hypothetical protein
MQFGAKRCAQRARWGAQGTMGGPHRLGQRAQDLQGRLTVSEGHGYPLVPLKEGIGGERRPRDRVKTGYFTDNSIIRHYWLTSA